MTDSNNYPKEPLNNQLDPIQLEPGIYDFTGEIERAYRDGIPLSPGLENILRTFKRDFSLEEEIRTRGREKILEEIEETKKYFDFEQAKQAVKEGLALAQAINPDVEIKPFPIVFLFVPQYGDAKSLHGQGCAISISALRPSRKLADTPYQKVLSYTAHEAVHTFLRQLGLNKDEKELSLKDRIYDFIWEEGLTTYIEPTHYAHHEIIKEDSPFYIDIISQWLDTDDEELKKELLQRIFERPSAKQFFEIMYNKKRQPNIEEMLEEWGTDGTLLYLLKKHNGIGYHIGSYLWEKQIKEGKQLKDLVMAGSGQMEEWVGER